MGSRKHKLPLKELKFLALFIAIYGVLQFLYFQIPDKVLINDIYYHGIVSVSADIINLFTDENVTASENKLSSSKAILVIIRGCDGAGSIFLLIAAILAFSATVKDKLVGVIAGVALLYIINQIRIIGLYFIVAYKETYFLPVHTYFAPTLVIILSGLFFIWWTLRATGRGPLLTDK